MIHDVKRINELLKANFGDDLAGNPIYRVVWSDLQHEKQFGEFEEFYGSIFVRRIIGVKLVKKYEFIQERWILEKLVPNPAPDRILVGGQSYECVYIFQGPQNCWLPAAYEVAAAVIRTAQAGRLLSASERTDKDKLEYEKEIMEMEEYMAEDGPSDLSSKRELGEGVFLGGGK